MTDGKKRGNMTGTGRDGKVAQMAEGSKSTAPDRERSAGFQTGQVIVLLALLIGLLLLGHSMVKHRFFQGGHMDRHGVLRF
jgi:hypothetical protein